MSYLTITMSVQDSPLRARVTSCVVQEAWNNESIADTNYAVAVRNIPERATDMIWPVCIASDVAMAYEYALNTSNPDPGGDPTVITDGMILANVQAKWPPNPA